MFITITGELGSGKTTIAKILNQEYGFDFYSTGSIQREIAKEKGITTLELNQQMSNDVNNAYDKMIDDKTVEISQKNIQKNIVFDSRMAWHFVEKSFKVYVTVDSYMAANRVVMADRGAEECYHSIEEAASSLLKRKRLEDSRFADIYSVNTTDFTNYNLIIDSTFILPNELAKFVFEKAKNQSVEQEIYLSPQRLFPTQTIRDINPDYVMELKHNVDNKPIDVIDYKGFYFIIDGHHRVCSKIQMGEKLVRVKILNINNKGYVEKYNKKMEEIVRIPKGCFYDWEDFNAMRFLGYPD